MPKQLKSVYNSDYYRFFELILFFIIVPFMVDHNVFGEGQLNKILPLAFTFVLFLIFLLLDSSFDNKRLISFKKYNWKKAALRLLIITALGVAYVYYWHNDLFFNFLQEKPQKFLIFLALYPIISVIPQEVIYRLYFFHRYEKIIENKVALIICNAILFGYLHFIYDNWIAVIGATFVGIIFIYNYLKTKSLINVSIEHYAYGIILFTLGLGKYFK